MVDVLVTPATQDAGGTQGAIQKVVRKMLCRHDVAIDYRGSVSAMEASFASFGFGLMMAVALLYLVMVAQFRSFLDPFIIMFAVPMGLIGVVWMLLLTHTTLNIESFMGIIVMVGIVVSNSILLVDFANQRVNAGRTAARRGGGRGANPDAPDPDDRAGHAGRSGPDRDGSGSGLRNLGAAGAGGNRRPGGFNRA